MSKTHVIKVLLADDHKVFREGIVSLLSEQENIDIVAEAGDGGEVMKVLHKQEVDVVLLDIKMPYKNGMEVAEIIKEEFPSVKILVFTSYDEARYVMKMFEIGVPGYILKTASSDELVTAIKTVYAGDNYSSQEVTNKVRQQIFQHPEGENEVKLTKRELEILKLVSQGFTNAEIGEQLYISPRTVDTHRRNLLQKLNLHNAVELARWAQENDLLD